MPAGHILQLHLHQGGDVVIAQTGDERIGQGGQQRLIIFQHSRGGGLADNGLNHGHLVFAPLVVAVGEGVPLPGEAQGRLTVQVIDTLGEVIAAHGEGLGGIYVHAAQSVHDLGETGEVHPHIEGRVGAVQVIQGPHGFAGAVDPGVGQLVQLAVVGQGQIVVPGGVHQ